MEEEYFLKLTNECFNIFDGNIYHEFDMSFRNYEWEIENFYIYIINI